MTINIFNFTGKRKRILELIYRHYLKLDEEIKTSSRWANYRIRRIKLEKLAYRLMIRDNIISRLYLKSVEERQLIQLKKEAQNYE